MTITITVGTNSFISLADAETYFTTRLNSTVWSAATADNKAKSLITATDILNVIAYKGTKSYIDQVLAFPRTIDDEYVDIPTALEKATCEQALFMLDIGDSVHIKNQQTGIQSINLSGDSVNYTNHLSNSEPISIKALHLLTGYIKKVGRVV